MFGCSKLRDRLAPGSGRDAKAADAGVRQGENFMLHAELSEQRPIDRIDKVTAELFPGKGLFLDQRNFIATLREADGGGRSGRTGTQCTTSSRPTPRERSAPKSLVANSIGRLYSSDQIV